MQVNKAIIGDSVIAALNKSKLDILQAITPKYMFNKETNTATAVFDQNEIEIIEKINDQIKHRTDQIIRFYTNDQPKNK